MLEVLRAEEDPEAKVRRKDTTFLLLSSSEKVSQVFLVIAG